LIASADAIFAFIISTTALLITRRTVHRFFFARTTIRGRAGRIAAGRRIGTRRRIGRSRIRRSFVSFFGSFFFFLFARGIVIFALLFEGSDFYADAAVVASERHGRVDLTFSVVHRFAGILRLSRHAFAESNGTDRTGLDRRVQFVFVAFRANDGDFRSISQFNTGNKFAFFAIFIRIRRFRSFAQRPSRAIASAAAFARRVGVYGARSVQIRTKNSQRDFMKFADFGRLRFDFRIGLRAAIAVRTALLTRTRIGGRRRLRRTGFFFDLFKNETRGHLTFRTFGIALIRFTFG